MGRARFMVYPWFIYLFFFILGLSEGNARGVNSAPCCFFCVPSQNAVQLQRMREVYTHALNEPREHGLKQRPPSWKIPRLMKAKEIRWLLRSMYIQSHTPFAVDPH